MEVAMKKICIQSKKKNLSENLLLSGKRTLLGGENFLVTERLLIRDAEEES